MRNTAGCTYPSLRDSAQQASKYSSNSIWFLVASRMFIKFLLDSAINRHKLLTFVGVDAFYTTFSVCFEERFQYLKSIPCFIFSHPTGSIKWQVRYYHAPIFINVGNRKDPKLILCLFI